MQPKKFFKEVTNACRQSNYRRGTGPQVDPLDSHKRDPKWRTCAKQGCKDHSEAYAKGIHYGFLASPYCSEHACRNWDRGQPCRNPTRRGEIHCDVHKECDEPKCSNSSKLVGKTKRSPWCAEHGCQQDMCKAAKYIKNFNLNSKYCTGHTCIEADCLELAGDTNHRCGRHTCAHATCYEPIVPKSEAEKGDKYCSKHKRCNVGTCNQEVKVMDNYRALKHCKDHYCTFEHECDDQRKDTSSACERHICKADGCNRKISGIQGAVYCGEGDDSNPPHECRNAQCTREAFAAVDSRFCVYHICRDYMRPTNCRNEGNPQKDGYCETHERCVLDGCGKLRFVNGRGERQSLCVDHARPCDTPGCGSPRAENGRRCSNHVCLASNDCQGIRVPLSTFCSGHKCAVPECPSQRRLVDGGLSISTLMALDPTGNNLHLALGCGAFCAKHTCAHDGCRERNFQEGKFCAAHTCRSKACLAEAQDKADYCPWHTCQSRNCTSEITEDGQHCVVHTCTASDCSSEAQTKGRHAGRCRYHEDDSDSEYDSSEGEWGARPGWSFRSRSGHSRDRHRSRRGRESREPGAGGRYPPSPYGLPW